MSVEREKVYAGCRSVVGSITEGRYKEVDYLLIRWARPDIEETYVFNNEIERELYEYLRLLFQDLNPKAVAGAVIDVTTDSSGHVVSIGKEGGETVSIREKLLELGYQVD